MMEGTNEMMVSPLMMRYKKDHPILIMSIRARQPQQGEDDNEDDEEEDSFHDIESEHSSHYHTPEPEPSALEFTVEKLFHMIQNGFHGAFQMSIPESSNNMASQLFSDPAFPSVIIL
jgi:hypothetical protein